jgi:hypothetical protein
MLLGLRACTAPHMPRTRNIAPSASRHATPGARGQNRQLLCLTPRLYSEKELEDAGYHEHTVKFSDSP